MNTPLNYAIDAGATTLHVVYLDPELQPIPAQRLRNTLVTLDRVYTIMKASKFDEDIETATRVNEGLAAVQRIVELGFLSGEDAKPIVGWRRGFHHTVQKSYRLGGAAKRPLGSLSRKM